jgi:hypothetical protein
MYKVRWSPEGKRPFERARHRWEDNIRVDLREIGWEVWIHLAKDGDSCQAVANIVVNRRVP